MIIKTKKGFSALFVFWFILLFKCANEADNAVDSKKDTYDEDHDVKSVTEREQKTNNNCKYGEYEVERTLLGLLERIDKSDYTLDSDKDTENEKYDLNCKPAENKDRQTDYKADSAACVVLLYKIKNTGYDEEDTRDSHCPAKCL